MTMTNEDYRNVARHFGIKQLISLIIIKRHRSFEPDKDPFILALEQELDDRITEIERGMP